MYSLDRLLASTVIGTDLLHCTATLQNDYKNLTEVLSSMQDPKELELCDSTVAPQKVLDLAIPSIYCPLSVGFIRIAIIHSGHFGQQIVCTLRTVSLADEPHFEALSYVWGEQMSPSTILVNDESFEATQNLEEALQYLRLPTAQRALWVDALCINQSDIQERNLQVRQMHKIYAKADRVLSWLGPSRENSDKAMELIKKAESHNFASSWLEKVVQDDGILWNGVHKVARLCLRDYWSRVWIVQELAHGQSILIMCGSATAKYTSLIAFAEVLEDISYSIPHYVSRAFYRSLMGSFVSKDARHLLQKQQGNYLEVSEVIDVLARRLCKDQRDMVYGVHSLLSPDMQRSVAIDYSKTTAEVYTSFARAVIETTGGVDPIVWIATRSFRHLNEDANLIIPSWVPNWTYNIPSGILEAWASLPHIKFSACGVVNAFFNFTENDSVLHTKGISIGLVQDMVEEAKIDPEVHISNHLSFTNSVKHIKNCFNTAKRHGPVNLDDFFMTWMGGLWHGQDIDVEYITQWKALITGGLYGLEIDQNDLGETFNYTREKILSHLVKRTFLLITSGDDTVSFSIASEKKQLKPTMGLASRHSQPGDIITVLTGCSTPVILRQVGKQYKVIGDVYICGFMSGEAMKEIEDGTRNFEDFYLC
jgi:hypothetical protein